MEKERVIFREEYDPYRKQICYLAIFPDDEAYPGRVAVIPFGYVQGDVFFEPYTEIDYGYMLRKKIVHKNDSRIPRLKRDIGKRYDIELEVIEKIMRR